jgi:hypothetical protein
MTVRSVRASTEPGVQAGRIDTLLALRTLAVLASSLLVTACANRALPPSGVPTPRPAEAPPAMTTVPASGTIAPPGLPASYALESRAVVVARADSLTRTDTLDTRAMLRVVPRGAAIDVTITTFSIQPASGPTQSLPGAVRAVGRYDGAGAVAFEGAARAGCGSIAAAAFEGTRDLWVKWPAELRVGDQWRDSASVALCRDGVPLQLVLLRRYVVTASAADSSGRLLTIDRRSTITVQGRGSIRGDSTTLAGEGTGSAVLRLSASTGWVIDGHGTSVLRLTARGTHRTQIVEQHLALSFHQSADSARAP